MVRGRTEEEKRGQSVGRGGEQKSSREHRVKEREEGIGMESEGGKEGVW